MNITYIPKQEIYPSFGVCYKDGTIKIREDLPQSVKWFVLEHEIYHSTDKATYWIWRELKANTHAAVMYPWGFIVTAIMSLSPYRLWYYVQRFKNNA
jgi:hypothetical protein